ncbi:MAG: hypothetical protein R2753_07545 [Chitinophagales bacterium]
MEVLDDNFLYEGGNEKSIESILENGYETHSVDYIKEAWELFKKNPGFFIGFIFINIIIAVVLEFLPNWATIIQVIITPCLAIGFFQVVKKIDFNEEVEFSNFFDGFKVWQQAVPFYILMIIFLIFAFILLILPGIYLAVGYLFAFPLLALYSKEQSLIDVLENSRKIISKNWLNWFGFCWLIVLFNIVGVLCLVIGVIVTSIVSYIAIYCAYKDVVGIN